MKSVEKNVENSLEYIVTGGYFINRQELRSTINTWDLLKPNTFSKANDTVIQTKQPSAS